MRGRAVTLPLILCGCLIGNPAYDDANGASASGTSSSSSEPTSGASGASGSTGDASAGTDSAGTTTDPTTSAGATTGDLSAGTGGSSSTGAPPPVCKASESLPVAVVAWDTGVVPPTMPQPCGWGGGGDCGPLNFGKTEYFRLVHDQEKGRSAALISFPRDVIEGALTGAGYTLDDVVSAQLGLVVWEPTGSPLSPLALGIWLLGAQDLAWFEGNQNAATAVVDDSSFYCRKIDAQGCASWSSPEGPLGNVTPLGELVITPDKVASSDEDQDPAQYHARILSDPLPFGAVRDLWLVGDPTYVVTVTSDRAIEGPEVGIKFKEASWTDPGLVLEVCTQWE